MTTLIGGGPTPAVFAAVAEYADGWMPIGGSGIGAALPELRRAFEARERDPSSLEVVPFGTIPSDAKLDHYRELGVTEVVLRVPTGDVGPHAAFARRARVVRAPFRGRRWLIGTSPVRATDRPWSGGGRDELAAALRRLMALTVTAMPPAHALRTAAARVDAIADDLESHVPEARAGARVAVRRPVLPAGRDASGLAAAMPFDMVIGSCNPVAPPIVDRVRAPDGDRPGHLLADLRRSTRLCARCRPRRRVRHRC